LSAALTIGSETNQIPLVSAPWSHDQVVAAREALASFSREIFLFLITVVKMQPLYNMAAGWSDKLKALANVGEILMPGKVVTP
jgi:hypothetical protein